MISSSDGADVTVPLSIGEWLLSFWPYHLQARQDPDPSRRPLEIIVNPGDVIFVPHGYWHMVINLEDSIAITQNYVSDSNLTDVLGFLKNKADQISGVRDRSGEAIQPEEMFETFCSLLQRDCPELYEAKWVEAQKAEAVTVAKKKALVDAFVKHKKIDSGVGEGRAAGDETVSTTAAAPCGFSFNFAVCSN